MPSVSRPLGNFPDDPRRHTALGLDHGGLQRIAQLPTQFSRELHQQRFINQIALGPVRQTVVDP